MKNYKVILGGTKGIGEAISLAFTKDNQPMIVVSRNNQNLEILKKKALDINDKNNNVYISLDMTKKKSFSQLFSYIDMKSININGVINNLPGGDMNTLENYSYEDIYNCVDKKVIPYLESIKYSKEYMRISGGGSIINIIGGSWKKPNPNMFVNSFINASLVNATMNMAENLAQQDININCIHPGFVHTDRYLNYRENFAKMNDISLEESEKIICQNIPNKKIGESDDLAQLVLFLMREESRYITGQNIDFDGGISTKF